MFRSVIRFVVVAAVAFLLGGLTSLAQSGLPDALRSLANSSGGWTMFVFLLVWVSRFRPLVGAILGLVSFELLLAGYAVVSTWRGFPYSLGGVFTFLALVAGPIIGVAAALTRHGRGIWPGIGVAVLSAVLIGEGTWALITVANTTGPVYWIVQLVLGVAFLVIALVRRRQSAARSALVVLVALVGAAAVFGGYTILSGVGPS